MTADERNAIRAERDRATRQRLLEVNDYEARRRRIASACASDSPIRASNQVRSVMRMLEERGC